MEPKAKFSLCQPREHHITQPFLGQKGVLWIFLQRYNLFAIAIYKPCMNYI